MNEAALVFIIDCVKGQVSITTHARLEDAGREEGQGLSSL